jgi:hypothetical protein
MPVFHFTLKQNNGIFSFQQTSILGPFNFYPQDLIMLEMFYEPEAQELHCSIGLTQLFDDHLPHISIHQNQILFQLFQELN